MVMCYTVSIAMRNVLMSIVICYTLCMHTYPHTVTVEGVREVNVPTVSMEVPF